jgi:hypothetical protein
MLMPWYESMADQRSAMAAPHLGIFSLSLFFFQNSFCSLLIADALFQFYLNSMARSTLVEYTQVDNPEDRVTLPVKSKKPSQPLRKRRKGESAAGLYYRIFWVVGLHLICCVALAVTILYALDGYMAIYPHTSRDFHGKYKLQVSDITTLISSALVVIKLLAGIWIGRVTWNSIFVLLQTQGLGLNEIDRMSYFIPPLPKHRAGEDFPSQLFSDHLQDILLICSTS